MFFVSILELHRFGRASTVSLIAPLGAPLEAGCGLRLLRVMSGKTRLRCAIYTRKYDGGGARKSSIHSMPSARPMRHITSQIGLLPLAFLSPAVTDTILTGCQPAALTSRTLAHGADIPFLWSSQATALGM